MIVNDTKISQCLSRSKNILFFQGCEDDKVTYDIRKCDPPEFNSQFSVEKDEIVFEFKGKKPAPQKLVLTIEAKVLNFIFYFCI